MLESEELFFGTIDELTICFIDRVESTEKIDFIAHQTNCEYIVGEVKLGQITKSDITKLINKAKNTRE
ncbi:MAG: hypothetical protein Q6363_000135 [Candidatus Njordarchaeota archaeon]